jgi:hypothetical protein
MCSSPGSEGVRACPRGVLRIPRIWFLIPGRPLCLRGQCGVGIRTRAAAACRATWLVLQPPERQDDNEAAQLARLKVEHPEVAAAIACAQDFARLVRERHPGQLDPWLARAAASPLARLRRFAKGLRDDYDAVKAGGTLP